MKRVLLTVIFVATTLATYAQEEDWLTTTRYSPTENCPDSATCYTDVMVDLNLQALPDSSTVTVNIGGSYGDGSLFTKTFMICSGMYQDSNIFKSGEHVATVSVGHYILTGQEYVEVSIE